MTIRIEIVGALRGSLDDVPVTPSQPKLRRLLALLAANPGTVVRHETITDELWSGPPSAKYARIVQTYVSQLRKLFGTADICVHTPKVGYRLALAPPDYLDAEHLLRLRDNAESHLRAHDTAAAADVLGAAVDLCRGDVLSDVSLGPVLRREKTRLDLVRVGVLERYLRVQLDLGHPEAVLAQVDRVMREDPRHEQLYASLLLGFAHAGQRARATDLFHEVRSRLARESGLEPGQALRSAFEQALRDEPAPTGVLPGLGSPAGAVRPLRGPRRDRPEQVLPAGEVFGHDPQAAFARAELTRSARTGPAVLAVVGAPGVGTSTFCARVAEEVRAAYPDGRLLADLAEHSPARVLGDFLRALRPDAPVPDGLSARAALFRRHTRDTRLLVMLDNVNDTTDLTALTPGSPDSALVLGCSSRLSAPVVSVELPRMSGDELLALFAARVGPARVEREPAAAWSLVTRCAGLPLVAAVLAELARFRPHWSLGRLAQRLADPPPAAGKLDLATSVARSAAALGTAEWGALARLAHRDGRPDAVSAEWVSRAVGLPRASAADLLDRLTWVRLADPAPPGNSRAGMRYRIDPLYLRAVRELCARSSRRDTTAWAPPARSNDVRTRQAAST
ncbi:AfsR/SARP family transcriptional regulator [Actinokineospora enzanensis]|uniref:AfsR/SARP family transcriptional regulator n=1 Tax=Actinokineospora enzanensis TaxID=155975 RepID=UPI00036FD817|nr:BTAD domain-containing putative transcriptional regulator [Actinokineospora enzanensis]